MRLEELLAEIKGAKVSGSEEADIGALCYDSRKAAPGSLFIAVRGNSVDGHDFVEKAEEQGVTAVLAECERPINSKVIWIQVTDSRRAMSQLAAKFYGEPSLAMKVAGVTGTNGKTTTGFLLHHLLKTTWHRAGLIGTVHYDLGDEVVEASHTTPESLELQGVSRRDAGTRLPWCGDGSLVTCPRAETSRGRRVRCGDLYESDT